MRFSDRNLRCSIGGDYYYPQLDGPAVYREPCPNPPTYRYRSDGMVEGHWSYRCAQHVRGMSAPGLVIEPLTAQQS